MRLLLLAGNADIDCSTSVFPNNKFVKYIEFANYLVLFDEDQLELQIQLDHVKNSYTSIL